MQVNRDTTFTYASLRWHAAGDSFPAGVLLGRKSDFLLEIEMERAPLQDSRSVVRATGMPAERRRISTTLRCRIF
jgi:hypothetical protein